MRTFLRDNGLTIVLMAIFLACLFGMGVAGFVSHSEELRAHQLPDQSVIAYLLSGAFLSALFENWESEFLQMAAYVGLTAFLFQRGSAESRDPDHSGEHTIMRRGWLYAYSLGLALAALFATSWIIHFVASFRDATADALRHGEPPPDMLGYLADAGFWFESFQNWQSEFLSTAVLVVLSIFLRFHGSPESKDVDDPDAKTGK